MSGRWTLLGKGFQAKVKFPATESLAFALRAVLFSVLPAFGGVAGEGGTGAARLPQSLSVRPQAPHPCLTAALCPQLPGSVRRMSSPARTATASGACGTVMATMTAETTAMSSAVSGRGDLAVGGACAGDSMSPRHVEQLEEAGRANTQVLPPQTGETGVWEDGEGCPRGPSAHRPLVPQTCESAQTRSSAAATVAVSPSTGTVMVTRTAKMAPTRRAVVSGRTVVLWGWAGTEDSTTGVRAKPRSTGSELRSARSRHTGGQGRLLLVPLVVAVHPQGPPP